MGKSLNYHSTNAAFDTLKTFSFIWRVERRGEGWFESTIYCGFCSPITKRRKSEPPRFFRSISSPNLRPFSRRGHFHANRLDWERGTKSVRCSRKEHCGAKRDVLFTVEMRGELIVKTNYQLGRISQIEGYFYLLSYLCTKMRCEYQDSFAAFDRALQVSPNDVSVHITKVLRY